MAALAETWEVVGGEGKGGIIVRSGKDTTSGELSERLATGSLVRALECSGGRLQYEIVSGGGPKSGWVTTSLKGKELVVRLRGQGGGGGGETAATGCNNTCGTEEEAAMREYCRRFAQTPVDDFISVLAEGFQGQGKDALKDPPLEQKQRLQVQKQFERELGIPGYEQISGIVPMQMGQGQGAAELDQFDAASDGDDEQQVLCTHCRLPLGEYCYPGSDGSFVHGECKAELLLRQCQREDSTRLEQDAELKQERRREYDIGWQPERIPHALGLAGKVLGSVREQGLSCLVLDAEANTLSVAATAEPAAAVNLEYLALALQVRRRTGREPFFSLDPVGLAGRPLGEEKSMQVKRFEPAWLIGTSVGELLFQADYYLKELSMGEYEQPVVGMRSCMDHLPEDGQEWNAREWFVVRDAEVQMMDDGVLVPCVKMGVEARELTRGAAGLEDAKVTRPDHPLVKYAEAFTRNFDLIAERKSVIFHLRELAKATVLAKFLGESGVNLDEAWFGLGDDTKSVFPKERHMVPQLWNERHSSVIRVEDGRIAGAGGVGGSMHGVYGGVDLGLNQISFGRSRRGGLPSSIIAMPAAGVGALASIPPARRAPPPKLLGSDERARARGLLVAKGVDLDLSGFALSEPKTAVAQTRAGSWNAAALSEAAAFGGAFWQSLEKDADFGFKAKDKDFLREVFNPSMSDRRNDGDAFSPPDASFSYVNKLRELVKEEERVRRGRIEHFLSKEFATADGGPLFPSSWRSSHGIARGHARADPQGILHARPEYKAEELMLSRVLSSVSPSFDRRTEDGTRFRLYLFAGLEVRTTQEREEGEEVIGAVFSVRPPECASAALPREGDGETIVKATEYVERFHRSSLAGALQGKARRPFYHQYYVVAETRSGRALVTEMAEDGTALVAELEPVHLGVRTSRAKVLRSTTTGASSGVTVKDLRAYRDGSGGGGASRARCRRYAQGAFHAAVGEACPPRRAVVLATVGGPKHPTTRGDNSTDAPRQSGHDTRQPLQKPLRQQPDRNCFRGLMKDA